MQKIVVMAMIYAVGDVDVAAGAKGSDSCLARAAARRI